MGDFISVVKQARLSSSNKSEKVKRAARWNGMLKRADVNGLWRALYRMVISHPLVQASCSAGLLAKGGSSDTYVELTKETFIVLLSKGRFQHYLDTKMSDAEIEKEISQIELTSLLATELKKRYPESYQLARRISTIIRTSKAFKRFDKVKDTDEYQRPMEQVYGLAEWPDDKKFSDYQDVRNKLKSVSFCKHNFKVVGCGNDTQIVISNSELEDLIKRILKAIDSPMDIQSLRSLVLSRLPVIDICFVPIDNVDEQDGDKSTFELIDIEKTPEECLLHNEAEKVAVSRVEEFLESLHKAVNGKTKQFNQIIKVLWFCYLSKVDSTQLGVAERLDISTSSISEYRRQIQQILKGFSFSNLDEVVSFRRELRNRVSGILKEKESLTS